MVTLGEHTFNQGADPVVKIGFRNVATDTWVTVDNDTVTLQVLYYTYYHTTNYTSWSFSLGHFQNLCEGLNLRDMIGYLEIYT